MNQTPIPPGPDEEGEGREAPTPRRSAASAPTGLSAVSGTSAFEPEDGWNLWRTEGSDSGQEGLSTTSPLPRRSAASASTALFSLSGSSVPSPTRPEAEQVPESEQIPESEQVPEAEQVPSLWRRVTRPKPTQPLMTPELTDDQTTAPEADETPDSAASAAEATSAAVSPPNQSHPPQDVPPIPRWVKLSGAIGIVVLLALAGWFGLSLGGGLPTPQPSASPTATWALEPPQLVGNLVRGDVTPTTNPAFPDQTVVRADYTDGSAKVVLILSRPQPDVDRFLGDAGVTDLATTGDIRCGTSGDTGGAVCARVVDETAIMLAGLTGQDRDSLSVLLLKFSEELVK